MPALPSVAALVSETLPRVVVRSAVALDGAQQDAVGALCRQRFGPWSTISFEVDPAVIGGVWLRVGDVVVDGSLAGKLNQLGHHLREQLRESLAHDRASTT